MIIENVLLSNKISIKKISEFRSLIRIESFNNSFCDTLGNLIRRTIYLTSFCYKIYCLKFYNLFSEFSGLKGVKEDIQVIIKNLDSIIIKIINDFSANLIIKKKGPCIIKAKDIFSDKKIFILNPNKIIAHLTKNSIFFVIMKCIHTSIKNIDKEFFSNKIFNSKIIYLNNFKSPILNINYFIQKKVFNKKIKKLFFDIQTNGVISPEECFKDCVFYLKKYFDLIFSILKNNDYSKNINNNNYSKNINNNQVKDLIIVNPVFLKSIDNLELSVRISNILKNKNIFLIGDLVRRSETYLLNNLKIKENYVQEIKYLLKIKGLNLNMKVTYVI